MGAPLPATVIIAGAWPFVCALTGRDRAAPVAPGVLALGYVADYFATSPTNETRGVALFIAIAICAVGACGWALGAVLRMWLGRRD